MTFDLFLRPSNPGTSNETSVSSFVLQRENLVW